MAPIFIIIASPFVLKEKITFKKIICVIIAVVGMVFVSGATSANNSVNLVGVVLGLAAAILYALVVFINKKINDISAFDKTIMQLLISAITLFPYVFSKETIVINDLSFFIILMLLIVGIVHTGVAYALYFDSIKELNASEVAIFSYIDPILAILISAFVLKETLVIIQIVGIILVLGSTIFSELSDK